MPVLDVSAEFGRCGSCTVRGAALCRSTRPPAGAHHRVPAARPRRLARDEVLFAEGEARGAIGVLRSGYLRVQRHSPDGRRYVVGLLAPGDIVDELSRGPAAFAVEASTPVEICLFDSQTVRRQIDTNPDFRRHLLAATLDRLDRLRDLTWVFGALTARERITAFLVRGRRLLPSERLPDGGVILTCNVPRRDWADLLNTTVETISRTLHELEDRGLIILVGRQRFVIPDIRALAAEAGIDTVSSIADQAPPQRSCTHRLMPIADDRRQCSAGQEG